MTISESDEHFLGVFCESADIIYNNGVEHIVFIKDSNFNFRYLSPAHIKYIAKDALFVAKDASIPESMQEVYERIKIKAHEQDTKMKKTLNPGKFIYIDIYNQIGLVYKKPIINPETGNFVGIIGIAEKLLMPNILELVYRVNDINNHTNNIDIQKPCPGYELTERQQMVLFLYLNKYSNTEISNIMSVLGFKLSKSRVNDNLEKLKYVFHATSKQELIKKAIAMSYHLIIPRKFLQYGSFEVNDEAIITG